ncbi:hypothetical protein V1506DRAFT_506422 [Lipomyces tetrasporus]
MPEVPVTLPFEYIKTPAAPLAPPSGTSSGERTTTPLHCGDGTETESDGNRDKVEAKYGKRWYRIWEHFLAYSTIISRQGSASCFQIILHQNLNAYHRWKIFPSQFGVKVRQPPTGNKWVKE